MGEEQLKGVITWKSTRADTNSTEDCPYNNFKHAVRFCRFDIVHGPQWSEPMTKECLYKTETTNSLDKLSQVSNYTVIIVFYSKVLIMNPFARMLKKCIQKELLTFLQIKNF